MLCGFIRGLRANGSFGHVNCDSSGERRPKAAEHRHMGWCIFDSNVGIVPIKQPVSIVWTFLYTHKNKKKSYLIGGWIDLGDIDLGEHHFQGKPKITLLILFKTC